MKRILCFHIGNKKTWPIPRTVERNLALSSTCAASIVFNLAASSMFTSGSQRLLAIIATGLGYRDSRFCLLEKFWPINRAIDFLLRWMSTLVRGAMPYETPVYKSSGWRWESNYPSSCRGSLVTSSNLGTCLALIDVSIRPGLFMGI